MFPVIFRVLFKNALHGTPNGLREGCLREQRGLCDSAFQDGIPVYLSHQLAVDRILRQVYQVGIRRQSLSCNVFHSGLETCDPFLGENEFSPQAVKLARLFESASVQLQCK